MKINIKNVLIVFGAVLIYSSCARNPVTGKKEFMLMTEGQEMAMGAEADPSIIQEYGLYDNQVMQDFINEKGKAMGLISHRPDIQYQFRILDSPVVNAFAVPGGYVYFTRGIMAHFNNEAEFAGVLGHEIGHITAKHSAQQYSAQMLGQIGLLAGIIASEKFRDIAGDVSQGLGLLFLKFGRDHESQSDGLGVEYSTKIGYDSHEMADFFQTLNRLQSKAGVSIPDFFSTHPNPVNRYAKVHELSDIEQQNIDKSKLKVNRDSYLNMIDGLVYGEDPKQGYAENNVFYHPELLFQFPYPKGWMLLNSPTQIQMAPEDGKALMVMTLSSEKDLNAAAQAVVTQYKLTVVESRNILVNGSNAIAMVSDQTPQDQSGSGAEETNRLLTYFIKMGDFIYIFHGVSALADFNKYTSYFTSTMGNFKKLTDQSKINVVATRIKVDRVKTNGTLEQAFNSFNVAQVDAEELAIVNGMELKDQVQAGTMIKLFSKVHNQPVSSSSGGIINNGNANTSSGSGSNTGNTSGSKETSEDEKAAKTKRIKKKGN